MKPFLHSCDFIVFHFYTHPVQAKVALYGLLMLCTIWAIAQNEYHALTYLHAQALIYRSDPWNG